MKHVKLLTVTSLLLCLLALASCSKDDKLGPEFTDPTYQNMECIAQDFIEGQTSTYNFTFLDTDFKKHSLNGYYDIEDFYRNVAIAQKKIDDKTQYGLIDPSGKEIVKFGTYDYIDDVFESPYFIVKSADEKYGVINNKGETILDCKYSKITDKTFLGTEAKSVCYFFCRTADDSLEVYNETGKLMPNIKNSGKLYRYINESAPFDNGILRYEDSSTGETSFLSEKTSKILLNSADYEETDATYCAIYYKGKNGQQGVKFFDEEGEEIKNISISSKDNIHDFINVGPYVAIVTYSSTTIYDSKGKVVKTFNGDEIESTFNPFTNEAYIVIVDENDILTVYDDDLKESFKIKGISGFDIESNAIIANLSEKETKSVYNLEGECIVKECASAYEYADVLELEMLDGSKQNLLLPSGVTLVDGEDLKYYLYNNYCLVEGDSYYRVISPEGKETFKFDKEKLVSKKFSISDDIYEIPVLRLSDGWFTYEGKLVATEKE